ncbi:hypothetical protein [Slackia heliotrinireducens]|uniref:hypothetical protein n=1 Tax=Slackia heliotrinireducens TaxID=84110 RepID=UPI003314C0AD
MAIGARLISTTACALFSKSDAALIKVASDFKDCYVFACQASPDSCPAPAYITELWSMFASMSGLEGIEDKPMPFHDLCDTFATMALANEVPVVTVAVILGYENANPTHKHFSHFMPSKNKDALDFMGGLLNASYLRWQH